MIRLLVLIGLLLPLLALAGVQEDLQAAAKGQDAPAMRAALAAGGDANKVSPYPAGVVIKHLGKLPEAEKSPWRELARELVARNAFPLAERGFPFPYRGSIQALANNPDETGLVTELLRMQPAALSCQEVVSTLAEMTARGSERGGRLAEWERMQPLAELLPAGQRQRCFIDVLTHRVIYESDRTVLLKLLDAGYRISLRESQRFLTNQTMRQAFDPLFFDQLLAKLDIFSRPERELYSSNEPRSLFEDMLQTALSTQRTAPDYPWNDWVGYLRGRANLAQRWHTLSLSQRCTLGEVLAGFWYESRDFAGADRHLARELASDYLQHCAQTQDSPFAYKGKALLNAGDADLLVLALQRGMPIKDSAHYGNDLAAKHDLARLAACRAEPAVLAELAVDESLLEIFLRCLPAPERQLVADKHLATLDYLLRFAKVNEALPISGALPLAAAEIIGQPAIITALRQAGAQTGKPTQAQRDYWLTWRLAAVASETLSGSALDPLYANVAENNETLRTYSNKLSGLGKPFAPHFVLKGLCGNVNCGMVLLGRQANGQYTVLLDGSGYDFKLGAMHKGLRDITLTAREGAYVHQSVLWRFDGQRYRPQICKSIEWNEDGRRFHTSQFKCEN